MTCKPKSFPFPDPYHDCQAINTTRSGGKPIWKKRFVESAIIPHLPSQNLAKIAEDNSTNQVLFQ